MTDPYADPHDDRTLEERLLSGFFPFLWRAAVVIAIVYLAVRIVS